MSDWHTYALGKYSDAAYILSIEPGDVRERIARAWPKLLVVTPSMVPEAVRADVIWIRDQILSRQDEGESAWSALRKIRNSTGTKIAERIMFVVSHLEEASAVGD